MSLVLRSLREPFATTRFEQAKQVHRWHVEANGTDGHTARDEWSRCTHPECAAFAETTGRTV